MASKPVNHIAVASVPQEPHAEAVEASVQTVNVIKTDSTLSVVVSVNDIEKLLAGEYRFWYDQSNTSFEGLVSGTSILELDDGKLFEVIEEGNGYLRLVRTRLSQRSLSVSGSGVVLALNFTQKSEASPIVMKYDLINNEYVHIESGVISLMPTALIKAQASGSIESLTAVPNPATAASSQSATEFSDDVANLVSKAQSEGGVVVTFDRTRFGENLMIDLQKSGPCGFYWSGYNRQGRMVASGVYQVQLKWETILNHGIAKTVIGIRKDKK